jgi:general secretion pathway protein I
MSTHEDGYTIIEALCAFAILSVVLIALYGIGGTSFRMLAASGDAGRAALLAQSKLDEVAAVRAPLPRLEDGQFDGTNIRWRMEAKDVALPNINDRDLHLQSLQLTLSWPARTGSNELVVTARHMGFERP